MISFTRNCQNWAFRLSILIWVVFFPFALTCYGADGCIAELVSQPGPYKIEHATKIETVDGVHHQVIRFPGLKAIKTFLSYDLPLSRILKLSFGDIFMKFIRPAYLGRGSVNRYKISNIIDERGNEVILGFDQNHTFLIFYDSQTKKFTRADSGGDISFRVQESDSVNNGVFFRFKNISPENFEKMKAVVAEKTPYATCTDGVCHVLDQGGIRFSGDENPKVTFDLTKAILKGDFQFENGVTADIFTTDPGTLGEQFELIDRVSFFNAELRNPNLRGYYLLIKYGSKAAVYWLYSRLQ